MKEILIIISILLFCSCSNGEMEYNSLRWEYKEKNLKLDYLERLYLIRDGVHFKEKIRVLDSLIENER